jgi:hypothetical protein
MPFAQGMSQSIVRWSESTAGTRPGTVNADKLPVINPRFTPARNTSRSNAQTGSPEPRATIMGKKAVDFSHGLECNPSSMAPPLYDLYGTREQQGTSALYHTRFSLGSPRPFGAQDGHTDISKFFPYDGLYYGSADFSFSTEGAMELQLAGMGLRAGTPVGATVVNGTTTDRTSGQPFSYLFGRVKKDGVKIGYVKMATLGVNRALGRDAAMDETDEMAVIFSEIATVGGNITALMNADAVDLYTGGLDGDDVQLEFYVPYGSGQGFWAVFPSAKLLPFSVVPNGTGLNTIEGRFEAQPGDTKGSARSKFFSTLALNGLTLIISVDGGANQTVTFGVGDDTPDEAIIAINAGSTGCVARVERKLGETGGIVIIESDTAGSGGSIDVKVTSTADALMGFDNVAHAGLTGVSHELWLANTVVAS